MASFSRTTRLLALGMTLGACSSSPKATPVPTGSGPGDGGSAADGGSVAPSDAASPDANGVVNPGPPTNKATACTAAPFVNFTATVSLLHGLNSAVPAAGATVGFSTCPGFQVTADGTGNAQTQITQGLPIIPFYSAPGALSAVGAEIPATGDVAPQVTLFAASLDQDIPGIQDGGIAPVIAVNLVPTAQSGPCASIGGVQVGVAGHPEAMVSYMDSSWPASASVASTTSSVGPWVFISGVQGASKVQLTAAKSGCTAILTSSAQTGNFTLVPGTITLAVVEIGS